MLRQALPAALFAVHAIGQCTIGAPGIALSPTPVDSWSTIQPIGFAFPFCGATYTGMYVSDHGMIALTNGGTPGSPPSGSYTYNPSGANFILHGPKIYAYWSDHQVNTPGSIRVANTSGTHCTVTWLDANTFGQTPKFTFQATLYPDGRIVLCLDNRVNNNGSTFTSAAPNHLAAIVGVMPGAPVVLPPMVDISTSPVTPDNTMWEMWVTSAPGVPNPLFDVANSTITLIPTNPGWIVTCDVLACASNSTFGAGCHGLSVASNSPVIGGTWTITTSGIDPISPLALTFFGAMQQTPALPMTLIGFNAPGCDVNIAGLIASASGPNVGGTATLNAPVPLNATLKNADLYMQSAALTLANPASLATSNGAKAVVGW